MVWLRTLLFTIIAPGTITILIPYWLLSSGIGSRVLKLGVLRVLGLVPLLLGVGIYLWCVANFAVKGHGTPAPYDPPKALVVTGLYRYVRNPMYIGVLFVLLGEAICFPAAVLFPYTIIVFICALCITKSRPCEDCSASRIYSIVLRCRVGCRSGIRVV
ncbi:MAG: phosphatidylethanolamine N-methyltransferase family protein [candidate division KSB1 bacterium]|nr:phosphatidylethanolamine N-methyltransferase family protein [candidate division KSB1 bacterium]MDZ7303473.1 phosphatidylethanolamine N-methyltransferase family protein [candidate division KSB1 bacterium]MDZ7312555.1 phosphatidylethanolamine N-methyltransferase family protein [candidate division KSB1 bacterium]